MNRAADAKEDNICNYLYIYYDYKSIRMKKEDDNIPQIWHVLESVVCKCVIIAPYTNTSFQPFHVIYLHVFK